MLKERPTPEQTRIHSTAYFALRRRIAELRGTERPRSVVRSKGIAPEI